MCGGKCAGSCGAHAAAACNHTKTAVDPAPNFQLGFTLNQQPAMLSNIEGNVKLRGKGVYIVTSVKSGQVRAMSGSTVIVVSGKVIANPGSTVIAYDGVEVIQRKGALVMRPKIVAAQ